METAMSNDCEAATLNLSALAGQGQPASGGAKCHSGPGAESGGCADPAVTVIERKPGWRLLDLAELWRYRELLFFLVWRDVKVRYKQTVLGAGWAIFQPLATMLVFSLFLGRLVGAHSSDVPYPLFVFAGVLPWIFFANSVTTSTNSIVGNQNLITKIYFPRLIIPLGAIGACLVDFAVSFGMLLVLMVYYGIMPGWGLLLAPVFALTLMIAALAVGTLLSALTVTYRDLRYILPFTVQLWMWATPTIYLQTESLIGSRWQAWLPLNPAYGLIYNFRQAMLGGPLDWYAFGVSAGVSLALLLPGCLYFRRAERGFADVI
jgi:lipopolysaccharide transport system permease protein